MTSPLKAPALFISHGAPTFAIEPGVLGPSLQALGAQLAPQLKAVLVLSPHWQTRDVKVMTTRQPQTVHDFGGFSPKLKELRYLAAGQPELADEAARLLTGAGFAVSLDDRRGLDHGAWVPLLHLLPQAQVPVFQVSLPADLTTAQAVKLGQALAPLRQQGVLIVGSGSMTHNLQEFRQPAGAKPEAYAQQFEAWVRAAVLAQAVNSLINYRAEAPHAARAHPTEEHFLPLLVALGAAQDDAAQVIDGGTTHGMLSMESYVWGLPQPASDRGQG